MSRKPEEYVKWGVGIVLVAFFAAIAPGVL